MDVGEVCPWLTPDVQAFACRIYETRDWEALLPLSDMLEAAGCDNADILAHLRGLRRCPRCLGTGKDHVSYGNGKSYAAKCMCCGEVGPLDFGPGWIAGKSSHARGCHVLDLLLGKE